MSWTAKLIVCMIVDLLDFTVFRLLVGIPIGELIGTIVGVLLFGPKGLFYLLEVLDPSEFIDGFIPTATIIAFLSLKDETARA